MTQTIYVWHCDQQGWQGLWGELTRAQRLAPQGEISAQRPAPPSAPCLAWASRSQGHLPDLFCPELNR